MDRQLAFLTAEAVEDTAQACLLTLRQRGFACRNDRSAYDACLSGDPAGHLGGLLRRFCGPRLP